MGIFCSVATLGSWRTTAGGGRALQSGAKSEAISHWSLKRVASHSSHCFVGSPSGCQSVGVRGQSP